VEEPGEFKKKVEEMLKRNEPVYSGFVRELSHTLTRMYNEH
jgi:hypothetical protein